MITTRQAEVLCMWLDELTEANWPECLEPMKQKGYTNEDIYDAWYTLADACGLNSNVPPLEDFDG